MQISVIIPVRNEADNISALIDALLSQSLAPSEIIITDGGSTDDTVRVVEAFAKSHREVKLFREAEALPGRGRNIGALNAANEWLAFIDAGVIPAHDWIARLARKQEEDPEVDVVFGSWEPVTDSLFKECAAIAYAYVPNRKNLDEVKQARAIFSSLMRRGVWESVGGFREDLRSAEDHLFIKRIDELNFKTAYSSEAVVRWTMQPSVSTTFNRFVVYSRNNLRAGLAGEWQSVLLVRYAALILCLLHLIALTPWWPLLGAIMFLTFYALRALLALWRNRKQFPASPSRTVVRFLNLIPIFLLLDAATMMGTFNWLVKDKTKLMRSTA